MAAAWLGQPSLRSSSLHLFVLAEAISGLAVAVSLITRVPPSGADGTSCFSVRRPHRRHQQEALVERLS
jgi:hypothetical protein